MNPGDLNERQPKKGGINQRPTTPRPTVPPRPQGDIDGQSFARGSTIVVHQAEPRERLLYVKRKGEPVEERRVPMQRPVGFKP
jgi:hypothetical protein